MLTIIRRLAHLVLITLLAAAPIAADAQSPLPAATGVASQTLANGLHIYVIEDHAAAVVQTAMWYRFGSLDETPGKTGLAHALEHMMFRGTHAISGGGLDDIAARLGATVNANTTEDYTHFYMVLPSDRLDLAIHIEADRMRGLLLRQNDWQLERGAVLSEIDNDNSQPVFALTRDVRAAAYPNSRYAQTALGVRNDVVRSTAADLRTYYNQWYAPNDAALVITGDVSPRSVFAAAERYFGAIPRGTPPEHPPLPDESSAAPVTLARDADYPYAVIDFAYRIPGDLDRDAAATQILENVFNSERSTFYHDLVLSKLTLGYNAYADTALHAGIFHVLLFVTPGVHLEDVRAAYERTLAAIRDHGIDPELVNAAKLNAARQALYARDSISGLGDRYGYALGVEGHDPADDDAQYAALDTASVTAAVKTYLATAAAVGTLTPRSRAANDASAKPPGGGVNDNFSGRAPNGPVVLAPWVRSALSAPHIRSKIAPHAYRLPNGLRLLVQPVHANATVFVSGTIAMSPAFDPPGKSGTIALTSGLLSDGSSHFDFTAQRRVADDLGADIAFGANFSAHGRAEDLDRMLALVADAELRPTFPADYFALLKDQAIANAAQRANNPDAQADHLFRRDLYAPNDPERREETPAGVRSITLADVRATYRRYFRPDRTTIVVAGDIDPATARAAITRAFGAWRNVGSTPRVPSVAIPPTRAAVVYIPATRDTVNVRLGQRAIGRFDPDFTALNLANAVLGNGGSFDTRLMHEIRERRGLVYGVSSSLLVDRRRGTFQIDLSANPANVSAAVRVAKSEVLRLTREAIPKAELDRARVKLIASTLVGEEATTTIVDRCENLALNRLPLTYYQTIAQLYGRITPADTLRVARRHLHPNAFVEVYEGPR